jgi:hypothetical protein
LEATGIGRSIELRPGGHLGDPNLLGTPVDADYPGFRRLTFFSVLGGVCPLLPEGAEAPAAVAVCTRMVAELEHSRGLGLEPDEVAVLAACDGAVETAAGRAGAWLQRALRRPFPRLTLRDGVRRSVETFARGYLLLHAAGLEMAELHPPDRTPEQVRQAREATDAALREADGRLAAVIAPVFQRSLGLLRQAAGVLAGFLGPAAAPRAGIPPGSGALRAEDKLLGGLVDQIALSLWNDREALAGLEKSFEGHLARQRGLTMPL